MNNILKTLDGKKTYLGLLAGFGYYFACTYLKIEPNEEIIAMIALFTGVSMRLAVNKALPKKK